MRTIVAFVSLTALVPCLALSAGKAPQPGSGGEHAGCAADNACVVAMEDYAWKDISRNREVLVRVFAPDLKHGDGPFPVVVFSHGGGESREAFGYLGRALAQHGYVILFLTHKGSDREAWDKGGLRALGTAAFEDRPRDVRFAIDRLMSADRSDKLLAGRVDPERVAVAGQCAGSTTALAVAGLTTKIADGKLRSYRDERAKAVVALSPQPGAGGPRGRRESLHDTSWSTVAVPALVVTGTRDFSWMAPVRADPRLLRRAYDGLPSGNHYLVEISGAEHHAFTESKPYYPAGKRDPRHHDWIAQAVLAFLDGHLKGNADAVEWLHAKGLEAATKGECKQRHKTVGDAPAAPATGATQTAHGAAAAGRYDFSALDWFLEKSLPRVGGGCSLILIQGNRVIYRKGYGTFTPDKVVPIASSSKWISGGVIMALVDAGKISLDDKASEYLPYFTGKKAGITIRQMFTHTHGLSGNARDHLWNTSLTMDEAVRKIAECELKADPGTALYYGGLGMQAAGRIAEIAAGKPWVEVFREKLGDPLGMKNTSYYAFGKTKNPNVAGGVSTCVDDYGNYLMMLLNGGVFKGKRVLSEKAVATMLANQSGKVPILRHAYTVLDCINPALAKAPYGIGCWLEDFDPKTGETTAITSGGGFGCMPFLDRKRNVAGVLLPHNLKWKRDGKGRPYNDAHRVYYEAKAIINKVFDAGAQPQASTPGRTPGAAVRQPGPSETAARASLKVHGDLAADYSALNGGRAVLVMIDGRIVFERYDNGSGPETATHLHSATKGFWGPVIAAMIEDGLIESFDELAAKTLPEWKDHPRKSRITLRHLLTLSAGLVQDVVNLQGHDRSTLAPDLYRHAIGVFAAREPGAVFQYGPSCYYVLGEIMKRKLASRKQTPLDYLKQRILEPIGVTVGKWVHDASGNPHIPNGAYLTARNWVKYGQWLLQGGRWNGKQIVRKDLLDELVKPSKANPGHGLALWLNRPGGRGAVGVAGQKSGPEDKAGWICRDGCAGLFAALGAGKCRMYVVPSLNMVAVRQGDSKDDRYDDNTFLGMLLTGRATGAVPGRESGPSGPDAEAILRHFDRNGDGLLSPNEAPPRIAQAFKGIDRNNDGKISRRELETVLRRLGARARSGRDRSEATAPDNPGTRGKPAGPASPPESPEDPAGKGKPEPAPRKPLYKESNGPLPVRSVELVEIPHKRRAAPLQVRVTYPEGRDASPVVVFSHYAGGSKDEYTPLVDHWASHGYVCILPNHPDSPAMRSDRGNRASDNWRRRPEEAAMVLDNLGLLEQKVPALRGRLDRERIGVGGHYIGSLAAGLLTGMTGFSAREDKAVYKDGRVKAALMISPVGRGQGLTERTWSGMDVPTLFLTGSQDFSRRTGNPPEWRTEPFRFCPPGDKYLVWIEGLRPAGGGARKGKRNEPIWVGGDTNACVRCYTLAFWDAYLKGDKAAFDYLNAEQSDGRIKVTTKHVR